MALREALQVQISQMVYRLFRWADGEYDFSQEERVEYDKEYVAPMSAESILMEGARILDEWPMIEKGIKSFSAVYRRANVEIAAAPGAAAAGREDEAARGVTLNDQERSVYNLLDGKRTVQEIVERCALSEFDTCRILFDLISRQLLDEVKATGQKTVAVQAPAVRAPREAPRVLLAIGYLLLVLGAGSLLMRRGETIVTGLAHSEAATPYLAPLLPRQEMRSIRDAIARSRMQRIDFAIQVYYLLNRGYPENLKYLVTAHLLKPSAILDPLGKPFDYKILPGGYRIAFSPSAYDDKPIELINSPSG